VRRDHEMFHILLALLSVLRVSGNPPPSCFIFIVPTKKPNNYGDGWTLPGPPRGVSVIAAQKKATAVTATNYDKECDVNTKARGKKKKNKATTKSLKSSDPMYWHDENDPLIVVANNGEIYATGGGSSINNIDDKEEVAVRDHLQDVNEVDNSRKSIKFTIRGNPRVLQRHRTARGFVYNPSRAAQELFRDCLLDILPRKYHPTILDDGSFLDEEEEEGIGVSQPTVLFPQDDFLKMSIVFRMKRPKSHFVSNKPGPGRLKPSAPGKLHSMRSDVDNLAKFVMDSLNGLVYFDDRQVISLNAIKVLDTEGLCRGGTDVEISVLKEDDF